MNDLIIQIDSVKKNYTTEVENIEILKDIQLHVQKGKKIAITGESGCGKSTLLNCIAGLDSVTEGEIKAGPYAIHSSTEQELVEYRRSYVGLIFQFHYLLKDFTCLENVMLPAFMLGLSKKQARDKAKDLLSRVRLEHRINHFPAQMSGGERQRAAVARALINEPSLILADEPTGNLDPSNADAIRDILFSVVSDFNKTLILVTHDLDITSLTDECYNLQNGRLYLQ